MTSTDSKGGVEEALSKDCDKGYSCTEEWVVLTDESVTTEAPTGVVNPVPQAFLSYSEPIEADTIKVTFDGTVYECEKKTAMGVYYCCGADVPTSLGGDFDWSQYPFAIVSDARRIMINTETAGTYQVKIEAFEETIETSECFEKAVNASVSFEPLILDINNSALDHTFADIANAYREGRVVILDPQGGSSSKYYYSLQILMVNDSRGSADFGGAITFADGDVWVASSGDEHPRVQ